MTCCAGGNIGWRGLLGPQLTPGSKPKTVDYPERYKGVKIDINKVCLFLDQLQSHHKEQIECIAQKFIEPVKLADFLLIALF